MTALAHQVVVTPAGPLRLVASQSGLVAVLWHGEPVGRVSLPASVEDASHPVLHDTATQLREYFLGERRHFSLPLDARGTMFQKQVWAALMKIPYGATSSYGELARSLGDPNLTRAVGAANGRNPISIIVPCHRVIGAQGRLTGFAGGLETKAMLLALEQQHGFQLR